MIIVRLRVVYGFMTYDGVIKKWRACKASFCWRLLLLLFLRVGDFLAQGVSIFCVLQLVTPLFVICLMFGFVVVVVFKGTINNNFVSFKNLVRKLYSDCLREVADTIAAKLLILRKCLKYMRRVILVPSVFSESRRINAQHTEKRNFCVAHIGSVQGNRYD